MAKKMNTRTVVQVAEQVAEQTSLKVEKSIELKANVWAWIRTDGGNTYLAKIIKFSRPTGKYAYMLCVGKVDEETGHRFAFTRNPQTAHVNKFDVAAEEFIPDESMLTSALKAGFSVAGLMDEERAVDYYKKYGTLTQIISNESEPDTGFEKFFGRRKVARV
jgi:hypothetical protein